MPEFIRFHKSDYLVWANPYVISIKGFALLTDLQVLPALRHDIFQFAVYVS